MRRKQWPSDRVFDSQVRASPEALRCVLGQDTLSSAYWNPGSPVLSWLKDCCLGRTFVINQNKQTKVKISKNVAFLSLKFDFALIVRHGHIVLIFACLVKLIWANTWNFGNYVNGKELDLR